MADWVNIGGSHAAVSAGSRTTVWAVNSGNGIYRYTNHDTNPWIKIPGGLSDIGAAADGTVWGVNSGNQIFRYTGDQDPADPWEDVPGSLKRIAVGSRTNVRGVDPAGKIYKYTVHHREEALADGRVSEWTPGNKLTSVNT